MALDLADYQTKAQGAVSLFWSTRLKATERQHLADRSDQGERSAVTAGKNMDGFVQLMVDIVRANRLRDAEIMQKRQLLTLPGFFRPTKLWDLLVLHSGRLIAALEFKSHVGPSFGNNANNRCEEALGTATDLWTAYREGAFGSAPKPFVGYLILIEDAEGSRAPIGGTSPHFPVFPEFHGVSYQRRYEIMCQKMMQEQLYTAATVIASPREAMATGQYSGLGDLTDLRTFMTTFAGHIAVEAAR
jgi:restriction endonuclease XhoI-like protein